MLTYNSQKGKTRTQIQKQRDNTELTTLEETKVILIFLVFTQISAQEKALVITNAIISQSLNNQKSQLKHAVTFKARETSILLPNAKQKGVGISIAYMW